MQEISVSKLFSNIDEMISPLFEGASLPFEVLGRISDFIKALGPTLDSEIYENKV